VTREPTFVSKPIAPRLKWLTFIFLATVFFLIQHDLFISGRSAEAFTSPGQELVRAAIEGNLYRQLAFCSLGLFGAVSLSRGWRTRVRGTGWLGSLLLFLIAWSFLSVAWADDPYLSLRRFAAFAMLCVGAFACARRFTICDITQFVLFSSGTYLVIGIMAEIALGVFHPFSPGYRFAGTLHPNHQGINCVMLVLSSVVAARRLVHGRRLLRAVALLGTVFLVLTGSRTAFAAAVVALLSYWAFLSSRTRATWLRSIIAALVCTFIFLSTVLAGGNAVPSLIWRSVMLNRQESFAVTSTFDGRTNLWNEGLHYAAERPLLGYGYGSFWTPDRISTFSDLLNMPVGEGHSAYLEILLTLGGVGLLVYLVLLIGGIWRSVTYYKASSDHAFAFLGAWLVFCLFQGVDESTNAYPTMMAFMTVVALSYLGASPAVVSCGRRVPGAIMAPAAIETTT
jgi:exopolysaccharide production protein ExoQ